MEITLHNTTKVVTLNGVEARVWEGKTSKGIAVYAYIPRIAVLISEDRTEFEKELERVSDPSPDVQAIPLRLLI